MSEAFPPAPLHLARVETLAQVFTCVVEGRSAWYISSPLTTGRRTTEWEDDSSLTYKQFLEERVIRPNRVVAREFVREIRKSRSEVVIDPTALPDVSGWSQDDYRYFWGLVIQRHASTVVFIDGWEYSRGCSYEYLVARRSGARTLRQNGSPLSPAEARALLSSAIAEEKARGLSPDFHEAVLESLGQGTSGDRGSVKGRGE